MKARAPTTVHPAKLEVLTAGSTIPGLLPLLDPDPSGHTLLTLDWQAACSPGRGRGAQAGPGCDSFLSTQPSAKQRGWQAGAGPQPPTRNQNPAQSGQASIYTQVTKEWPWQEASPCLSDHQQAPSSASAPVMSPSPPCHVTDLLVLPPHAEASMWSPSARTPCAGFLSAPLAWHERIQAVRNPHVWLPSFLVWILGKLMASLRLCFLLCNMRPPLQDYCKDWE